MILLGPYLVLMSDDVVRRTVGRVGAVEVNVVISKKFSWFCKKLFTNQ